MASCCVCCVCIGGVNFTKACSACGGGSLAMSTVNPNPAVKQNSSSGNCGGASCLSNILNAVGKWGTVLTATAQGKPVATSKTGVAVGAKTGYSAMSGTSLILILVVVGLIIYFATR